MVCIMEYDLCAFFMIQNAVTFDEDVSRTQANYPYLAMVEGTASIQFYLIVERIALCSSSCFVDALWAMMGA